MECGYCAVRTVYLNITRFSFVLNGLVMAQAVGRRPLNAENHVQSQSVHVRSEVEKVKLWHISLPVLKFSPKNIIPGMLHTHIY